MDSTLLVNIRDFAILLSIEGESMRSVTSVIIEEVKSGDWGIGGNPLATNYVKALVAGKSKG